MNKEDIIDAISKMSVLEINELVSMIEKKFSILKSEYQNSNNDDKILKNKLDEKLEFKINLKSIGNNKISVIKYIRSITSLGLKEAKDLVESCPIIIKEKIKKDEALKIKKDLESYGSVIELL